MAFDFGAERLHLLLQRRQGVGVALVELPDAGGELLGQPLDLALDGGLDGGEPLVSDDECLDLRLGQPGVVRQHFGVEFGLGVLDGPGCPGLGVDQRQALLQHFQFVPVLCFEGQLSLIGSQLS